MTSRRHGLEVGIDTLAYFSEGSVVEHLVALDVSGVPERGEPYRRKFTDAAVYDRDVTYQAR